MHPDRTALNQLYALMRQESEQRYPNLPYHYTKTFCLTKTNDLTKAVIKWIQLHGGQAERINTTGRMVDRTQKVTDCLGHSRIIGSVGWIPGTGTKGSADISATINGKSVKIEIKNAATHDRMSEAQHRYKEQIERAGGVYMVVRTFGGFVEQWNSLTGIETVLTNK